VSERLDALSAPPVRSLSTMYRSGQRLERLRVDLDDLRREPLRASELGVVAARRVGWQIGRWRKLRKSTHRLAGRVEALALRSRQARARAGVERLSSVAGLLGNLHPSSSTNAISERSMPRSRLDAPSSPVMCRREWPLTGSRAGVPGSILVAQNVRSPWFGERRWELVPPSERQPLRSDGERFAIPGLWRCSPAARRGGGSAIGIQCGSGIWRCRIRRDHRDP